MTPPLKRTAVVLLASGLSRRFGWRDKLMQPLYGKPVVDHAAAALARLDPVIRIAVCPADRHYMAERLSDRFVIALNKKPGLGLGNSIAVGVQVAMQFKPESVVLCMGDMPFIEPSMVSDLVGTLGGSEKVNIVHSGAFHGARPPAAFDENCFRDLSQLREDDGAKRLLTDRRYRVKGIAAPAPLLADIDTRADLDLAHELMKVREKHLGRDGNSDRG
jgi:molybdenum cofactor cytidylyltransferase